MPVDEEIDLSKPLSQDDIDKINREADEIEEAAERAEKSTDKIEKQGEKAEEEVKKLAKNLQEAEEKEKQTHEKLMNSDKIRKIAEKHGLASGAGPTGGVGGGEGFEEREDTSPMFGGADETGSGATLPSKGRDKSGRSPIQGLSQYQQMMQKFQHDQREAKAHRKAIDERGRHLMQKITAIERAQEKVLREFQQGLSMVRNPIGFMQNKLFGVIGKVIPIAMILMIAQQVFELIKTMFGPGGTLDVRKLVKDEVFLYFDIEVYNKLNRGEIFFGAAGAELTQGVGPMYSNTQDKFFMQQRDANNDFAGKE